MRTLQCSTNVSPTGKKLHLENFLLGRRFFLNAPSFVVLAPSVRCHVEFTLEVLCALDAVVQTEARSIFVGNKRFQLRELFGAAEVGMNLIEIAVGIRNMLDLCRREQFGAEG